MGLFTKTDQHGNVSPRVGRIAGTTAAGVIGLATVFNSLYIVEQREVALEIMFGKVNEVVTEPGLYTKTPFVESRIKYPLYRQKIEISADEANLRTKDQMRVEGGVFVDFEIDETSANIKNLYADLRGDIDDIKDAIKIRAKEAAVIAFGKFSSVDLTTQIDAITNETGRLLQDAIDEQGWPFHVKDVTSNGVRLSPDSEKKLERVMAAEQELTVLELRERNAEKAEDVLEKEGKALGALYTELEAAGVPQDQISTIICLKMANDADQIQEAFAPGCFPGQTQTPISVAVDPANITYGGQQAPQPAMPQ